MRLLGRKLTDEQRAEELFSPYIDGQVNAEERRFLERYLAIHPEAREKFELLKAAVQMTKTLPQVKAPRSFVLPRSMARQPSLALRLYPAMRLATVAAMALFVFALVGDLATSSRFAPAQTRTDMLPSARSVEPAGATPEPTQAPAPAAPTEAPAAEAPPAAAATATPMPKPTQALAQAEPSADAGSKVVEGTEASSAADSSAAPTGEPEEPSLSASDATSVAEAQRLGLAESGAAAEAPPAEPAPIDVLRLAVIALAAVAVVLTIATLWIRQRAR